MALQEPSIASTSAPPEYDLEKGASHVATEALVPDQAQDELDIEHVYVENDPRNWSRIKKVRYARLSLSRGLFGHIIRLLDVYSYTCFCCIVNRRLWSKHLQSCVNFILKCFYSLTMLF